MDTHTNSNMPTAQELLISSQFALFAYICALVGDTQDAKDVLQETNLKLMRELPNYDAARPFMPWARSIAYYEVLSYRTRKSRDRLTLADETFFDLVAKDAETASNEVDHDIAMLERCLKKLPAMAREVVESRYFNGTSVNELARRRQCSANAVSLLLFKARKNLADCIQMFRQQEVPT